MLVRWLSIGLVLTLVAPGFAATFTVNATDDRIDADSADGRCDADLATPDDQCTLRAAVQQANASPGADTIMLPAGTYRLTLAGASEDEAATGDLDLFGDITIVGAGASTTVIVGKKAGDRVFEVFGTATVSGVTIKKGVSPSGEQGGCIRVQGALTLTDAVVTRCATVVEGGGIYAEGTSLTLRDVTLSRNRAGNDAGGFEIVGGTGDLTRVLVTRNAALDESGGFEVSRATVTLTDSRIRNNRAVSEGGAFENEDGGRVTLTNCQVTGNHAKSGGGITNEDTAGFPPSVTTVQGSTITKNSKQNCKGTITSLGGNRDSDGTCKF